MQNFTKIMESIQVFGSACKEAGATASAHAVAESDKARYALIDAIECNSPTLTGSANLLRYICHSAAKDAGWWRVSDGHGGKMDVRSHSKEILVWWIGTKIALMHSELSEGLEGLRKDEMDKHLPHLKSIDVELADAIIRIMDLCGGLGIDIGRAITEKLAYNAKRDDHKIENRDAVGGKAF